MIDRATAIGLALVALFVAAVLLVGSTVGLSRDAVGSAFVLAALAVALVDMPLTIYARHSRRPLRWIDWFADSNMRVRRPWRFWLRAYPARHES